MTKQSWNRWSIVACLFLFPIGYQETIFSKTGVSQATEARAAQIAKMFIDGLQRNDFTAVAMATSTLETEWISIEATRPRALWSTLKTEATTKIKVGFEDMVKSVSSSQPPFLSENTLGMMPTSHFLFAYPQLKYEINEVRPVSNSILSGPGPHGFNVWITLHYANPDFSPRLLETYTWMPADDKRIRAVKQALVKLSLTMAVGAADGKLYRLDNPRIEGGPMVEKEGFVFWPGFVPYVPTNAARSAEKSVTDKGTTTTSNSTAQVSRPSNTTMVNSLHKPILDAVVSKRPLAGEQCNNPSCENVWLFLIYFTSLDEGTSRISGHIDWLTVHASTSFVGTLSESTLRFEETEFLKKPASGAELGGYYEFPLQPTGENKLGGKFVNKGTEYRVSVSLR